MLESSRLPLLKWVYAVYLEVTSLKGVSSMKLHRDIDVAQSTAWHMLHRIRKAFKNDDPLFSGIVEVDETHFGGRERNKHQSQRSGKRGPSGKATVVGARERSTGRVAAASVPDTTASTLCGFVDTHVGSRALLMTDGTHAYSGYNRVVVNHSVGEYVRGMAHTNGIESFWAMLKRAYQGVYHHISRKHLHRYVGEFASRHNLRPPDTVDQMSTLARGMIGKRLTYAELVA